MLAWMVDELPPGLRFSEHRLEGREVEVNGARHQGVLMQSIEKPKGDIRLRRAHGRAAKRSAANSGPSYTSRGEELRFCKKLKAQGQEGS
jgi:hypothetical protein